MVKDLLNWQKLELKRIIEAKNMSYADFVWGTVPHYSSPSTIVPKIVHQATRYYFEFHFNNSWDKVRHYPGSELPSLVDYFANSWEKAKGYFRDWLKIVTSELEAIKLLNEPAADDWIDEKFGFSNENEQDHFSPSEQKQIAYVLNIIQSKLLSLPNLTPEFISSIKDRIEDIDEAKTRLSRRDWKDKFKGFMYDVAVSLGQEAIIMILGIAAQKLIGN